MASVIKKVARKWNLTQHGNLVFGRINDIFINLTFVKNVRENVNLTQRDYNKLAEVYLFEALIQPKFESVSVSAYVTKKGEIDIQEMSGFLDTHYESFRTSLPIYVNGYFGITLYQRDAVNVKAWYVNDFLQALSDFLNQRGYFSGCQKCRSNDNLSQVCIAGKATEICENCRLKEAKL